MTPAGQPDLRRAPTIREMLSPPTAPWGLLVFVMVFPSVATWVYFVLLSGSPSMGPMYAVSKLVQFGLPLAWLALVGGLPRGWRMPQARGAGWAIGFGFLAGVAIVVLYSGWLSRTAAFAPFPERLRDKLVGMGAATVPRFVALAAFLSLAHSLLEECYWRWFVFGHLARRIGTVWGVVVSSAGFAAHHVIVLWAYFGTEHAGVVAFFSFAVAAGGAFWAAHYAGYRSLAAIWVSHLLVDVALMVVGYQAVWGG